MANGKNNKILCMIFDIISHTFFRHFHLGHSDFLILPEARAVQAKFECRETETGA